LVYADYYFLQFGNRLLEMAFSWNLAGEEDGYKVFQYHASKNSEQNDERLYKRSPKLDRYFYGTSWSHTSGKLETDILLGMTLSHVNIRHRLVYLPL
jgi:hypothetical protein